MIYSSVNRDGRIVRLRDRRTLPKSGGSSGSQVTPHPQNGHCGSSDRGSYAVGELGTEGLSVRIETRPLTT